ncbi:MAG: helix-turn-helix transcriptional regulator [Oscillospiraceae bacterium]
MENRIESLRKARKMTQQAMAEQLGVSRQTIISLESGRYSPSIGLAHRIAKLFGLRIEDVFIFDEEA